MTDSIGQYVKRTRTWSKLSGKFNTYLINTVTVPKDSYILNSLEIARFHPSDPTEIFCGNHTMGTIPTFYSAFVSKAQ